MRRKYLSVWIGLSCGLLAALFSASGNRSLVSIFLAPWTGLGAWLRSLSQSGSAGNAAAWALCIFLSLLPAAALLPSRKRRKQRSDLLILPVCASAFVCLYLLVNPTLLAPAALREEMKALFSAAPAIAFLSILLAAVLIRWSGRLEERRLFFWLKALIRCVSALTSSAVGYTLASSLLALAGSAPSSTGWLLLLPTLLAVVPYFFFLRLLDGAVLLAEWLERGFFTAETERAASALASLARQMLVASACCLAGSNAIQLLIAPVTGSFSISVSLPLSEMLLSAVVLLLSNILSAALRLQQDNDLMI